MSSVSSGVWVGGREEEEEEEERRQGMEKKNLLLVGRNLFLASVCK